MDIVWMVLGVVLVLVGIVGSVLPMLPGPPLAFVGLLVQQLRSDAPFSTQQVLIWLAITIVITILDYWVPIYGTKKFGGTQAGAWGATIGLLLGFFLGPWGIILGPFLGALAGELMANQESGKALKAAFGSLVIRI
jgi:uncharacterized protein YqgC (DUF456 family)